MSNISELSDQFSEESELPQRLYLMVRYAVRDMSLPESAVDDVYQSVVTKLLRLPESHIENITNISAYLHRVARNEAINFRSAAKYESQVEINEGESGAVYSDEFEDAQKIESDIWLREMCEYLTSEERHLLQLMIIGYNEKDIGLRLGINHNTARKRVSRLRGRLRELINRTQNFPA